MDQFCSRIVPLQEPEPAKREREGSFYSTLLSSRTTSRGCAIHPLYRPEQGGGGMVTQKAGSGGVVFSSLAQMTNTKIQKTTRTIVSRAPYQVVFLFPKIALAFRLAGWVGSLGHLSSANAKIRRGEGLDICYREREAGCGR